MGDAKMGTVTLETIHKDLQFLKKEIKTIKENMVDVDTILTEEEKKLVDESIEEEKKGELIGLDEVKKRLGIK